MTPLALQLAALDEDKVSPGLLGFTVVAILAVATWILLKSMTKQLKRVNFEEKDTRGDDTGGGRGGGRADTPDGSPGQSGADPVRDTKAPRTAAGDGDTAPPADAAEAAEARETQGNAAR